MRCPECKAEVQEGWACCMECGADLVAEEHHAETPAPAPLLEEGTPPVEDEGWVQVEIAPPPAEVLPAVRQRPEVHECPNCGAPPSEFFDGACFKCSAQAVFSERDDFYIEVTPHVAAYTYIGGHGHDRNEDCTDAAVVLQGDKKFTAIAVGDGVSNSKGPQEASSVACAAAIEVMREAAKVSEPANAGLLARAIDAAWQAVKMVKPEIRAKEDLSDPATTIVLAYAVDGEDPFVGWCGDSRAYGIYKTESGLVCKQLTRDQTILNDVLDEMAAANPEFQPDPAETMAEQMKRAETYLGQQYKKAFEANDEAAMTELKKDVEVVDAANGLVVFTSMHTMTWCLKQFPEGLTIRPCFARVDRENLVCLFVCSDGIWNDLHPMESIDAPQLAEIYAASNGDALTFVQAAVKAASGTDNDSCAAIIF